MNIISLKRFNLRNKIMFAILPLVLAAIAVLAVYAHNSLETAVKAEIREDIRYKTVSLADHAADWIRMQTLNLETFSGEEVYLTAAKNSPEGKADGKAAGKKMADILNHYVYYECLALTDLKGNVIAASNEDMVGVSIADSRYYKDILKQRRTASYPKRSNPNLRENPFLSSSGNFGRKRKRSAFSSQQ